ncbi:hypothetical protein M406DRAFT_333858 [Cryphonectria parasitica EP155]|uniref:Uncharacterized protein n=1 Tax=Cryphonectria parasitica (strain ATCC 38755 / EP155) TaxID=660469 RepID=A0A9P5CLA3_CRYP1|nr:uncharacterized protein M406DRAFT_333858 [Cryphonectria parasitica EP155]KAF3761811.1 hypothetical protein M406DRAFT_333858 [Cryphonectria parasitica EP155]
MEAQNGKTTVWVPKEAFESVRRLWKPEFNWIPVPVDRSLPPDQIAYIDTAGPVSPLPPAPRTPKTPALPMPRTPRTPLDLPPLETTALSLQRPTAAGAVGGGYFGSSPELETAITAGFSPGDSSSERPDTPSTATEPESPATPKDDGPGLPKPAIWRQSQATGSEYSQDNEYNENEAAALNPEPFNALHGLPPDTQWKMVDKRARYGPRDNLKPASWKTLDGPRDLGMRDHWQTFRRDEAHWNGSEKGFAVRLDMHLNVEVELKGTVNGDITLSAEALHYDSGECPIMM